MYQKQGHRARCYQLSRGGERGFGLKDVRRKLARLTIAVVLAVAPAEIYLV